MQSPGASRAGDSWALLAGSAAQDQDLRSWLSLCSGGSQPAEARSEDGGVPWPARSLKLGVFLVKVLTFGDLGLRGVVRRDARGEWG